MKTAPKLVKLMVGETSGVNSPAHLVEGWMVMKSKGGEARSVFETFKAASLESEGDPVPTEAEKALAKAQADLKIEKAARIKAERELTLRKDTTVVTTTEPDIYEGLPPEVATFMKARDDKNALELAELRKSRDEVTTELAKAREAKAIEVEVAKAKARKSVGVKVDEFSVAMAKMRVESPELAAQVDAALDGANAQLELNGILKAAGTSGAAEGSADAQIDAMASERLEKGLAKSKSEAISQLVKANTEIYTRSEQEAKL